MSRYFLERADDVGRLRWLTSTACLLLLWIPPSYADDATVPEAQIEQIEIMLEMEDGVKIWGCISKPANLGTSE